MSDPIPTPADGGPAFPETRWNSSMAQDIQWCGMSLFDYAAIKAMQGALTGLMSRNDGPANHVELEHLARRSYDMAAVMVAEKLRREKLP